MPDVDQPHGRSLLTCMDVVLGTYSIEAARHRFDADS
jgi:hypothetical protein